MSIRGGRARVVGGRVVCGRLGAVVVDRCRECVYLVRLDMAARKDLADVYVVCAGDDPQPDADFSW